MQTNFIPVILMNGKQFLTNIVYFTGQSYAKKFHYSVTPFSFFFFPDAALLVCAEPGSGDKQSACAAYFHHTPCAGLSQQQRVQQLYGQGYRQHWGH